MQARFVSLALSYSLVGGVLRRKGVKQRPWLELRRLETESTYLGHQLRSLRCCAPAGFIGHLDAVAGQGFYDIRRARIHSPHLERVMELACPDGEQRITQKILGITGDRGLAAIWLDGGTWERHAGVIDLRNHEDAVALQWYLKGRGFPSVLVTEVSRSLRVAPSIMAELTRLMRPHVHRSMRAALRPGSRHGALLLSGRDASALLPL